MRTTQKNGYKLYIGDEPLTDVPGLLQQGGALRRNRVTPAAMPRSIEEEERGLARLVVQDASGSFDRTRQQVKSALQAIAQWALEEYQIPTENGCDFGSGATGFMVEELLHGRINKSSWTQVDVHPQAVVANRRTHPDSNVKVGSYLRVQETLGYDQNLDVATGLSSLDATQFVPQAVTQIRNALKPGGTFLHIQDVRPGTGTGFREMAAMGIKPPYSIQELAGNGVLSPIMNYELPNGSVLNVGELFRRNLGRAISQDPELELLGNDWVTAKKPLGTLPGRMYFLNILLQTYQPFEEASAVVTVARRKA